ncbi:hypothetical protein GCM10023149_31310 [Mucilaginibacter gynuensis]|uniref:6-bladed beta-propeller protein n=1 Tax=Mucilaginibacter gynuensis TaxID=1302236 RepID=A0ABP8GPC4_9SPHI
MLLLSLKPGFGYAQARNNQPDTNNVTEIRIDPRAAKGEEYAASEVFSSVRYIPLESTSKSAFGKVDQLEITDEYFIILDAAVSVVNSQSKSGIFLFSKDGKFHSKLEGFRTIYFAVNREKKEISVLNFDDGKWMHFNYEGKLLRSELPYINFADFTFLKDNTTAFYRGYSFVQDKFEPTLNTPALKYSNVLFAKNRQNFATHYLPYDTLAFNYNDAGGLAKYFRTSGDYTYLTKPYDYSVYHLKGTALAVNYQFIFPAEQSLPRDFLYNKVYLNKRRIYAEEHKPLINLIGDFYKAGNHLSFKSYSYESMDVFIYNLKSGELVSFSGTTADKLTHSLPLGLSIHGCDGVASFFSSVRAVDILSTGLKTDGLTPELAAFVKKNDKRSNPLLVELIVKP